MKLLLICILNVLFISIKAQFIGWPTAADSVKRDTVVNGETFYTDNVSGYVLNINVVSPFTVADISYDISHSNFSTSNLKVNDWVLIYQSDAINGTEGYHWKERVVSIDTLNGVVKVTVSNLTKITSFSSASYTSQSTDKVQLIKIPLYRNFTLNAGQVTCHKFNGYTGGVLCMLIANDLTINGGYFNGTGRGMDYLSGNVQYADQGFGGPPSLYYYGGQAITGTVQGRTASTPDIPCILPLPDTCSSCPQVLLGLKGTKGDAGLKNGYGNIQSCPICNNNYTTTTYYSPLNVPFYDYRIPMGNPGTIPTYQTTGIGGGGGGRGGIGGNSYCNSGGNVGDSGNIGGYGGRSGSIGKCMAGGASILLKIYNLQFGSSGMSFPRFVTNGANGQAGGCGERGGYGGKGGAGGKGCCNNNQLYLPGTTGGSGGGGKGAAGSMGGSGGHSGTIWLKFAGSVPGALSSICQVKGGLGGAGGLGGVGGKPYEDSTARDTFSLGNCSPYRWCTNSGAGANNGGLGSGCNCDMAMCILKQKLNTIQFTGAYTILLKDQNGQNFGTYNSLKGELVVYNGGIAPYKCNMYSLNECDSVFRHMSKQKVHPLNVEVEFVPNSNFNCGTDINWYAKTAPGTLLYTWKKGEQCLVDYTQSVYHECYAAQCYEDSLTDEMLNAKGADASYGENTVDGVINNTASSNVKVEGNQPNAEPLAISKISNNQFTLTPNPASGNFAWIEGVNSKATSYRVIGLDGKIVKEGKLKMNNENVAEFDLTDLPRGVLHIQIYNDDIYQSTIKFIHE